MSNASYVGTTKNILSGNIQQRFLLKWMWSLWVQAFQLCTSLPSHFSLWMWPIKQITGPSTIPISLFFFYGEPIKHTDPSSQSWLILNEFLRDSGITDQEPSLKYCFATDSVGPVRKIHCQVFDGSKANSRRKRVTLSWFMAAMAIASGVFIPSWPSPSQQINPLNT